LVEDEMKSLAIGIGVIAILSFGACAEDAGGNAEDPAGNAEDLGYGGTGIRVDMGALTLLGATDVCYSFTIINGLGQLVVGRGLGETITSSGRNPAYAAWSVNTPWVQSAAFANGFETLCSTQFGNGPGGDWSYVAFCDAQDNAKDHTVTVWLDRLTVTGEVAPLVAGVDFQDPCPTGCALNVQCVENADTPVSFNFTIMRQAHQGFFRYQRQFRRRLLLGEARHLLFRRFTYQAAARRRPSSAFGRRGGCMLGGSRRHRQDLSAFQRLFRHLRSDDLHPESRPCRAGGQPRGTQPSARGGRRRDPHR